MMKSEFREKFDTLTNQMADLNDKVAAEKREMTAEESAQFNAWAREAETLKTKAQMAAAESNTQAKREKKSLVAQIREAIKEQRREVTVTTNHDSLIKEDIQSILDPLYTNSVLAGLGVRYFSGLPMGDIKVPVLSKGSVSFEGEVESASEYGPTFSAVTLKPKRISAYVDISKQLLLQDGSNAEDAIMKDLAKAVADKLEATIFGYAAGTTTQPAGMFYGQTLGDANTFAKLVAIEGGLEDSCVNLANCKYLLSPKAKATLRTMATNGNGSPRALTNGEIDGTPTFVSANVKDAASTTAGAYIYGDWSNLAVGTWGNAEIGIYDDSRTAVNGVIRLVVNFYVDAQVLRAGCFTYGDVRHS